MDKLRESAMAALEARDELSQVLLEAIGTGGWIPTPLQQSFRLALADEVRSAEALRAALAEQAPARVPLTEQQIVACITEADCHGGAMRMSYGSGPYEITRPTLNALAIVRAIERAHGIGAAP